MQGSSSCERAQQCMLLELELGNHRVLVAVSFYSHKSEMVEQFGSDLVATG